MWSCTHSEMASTRDQPGLTWPNVLKAKSATRSDWQYRLGSRNTSASSGRSAGASSGASTSMTSGSPLSATEATNVSSTGPAGSVIRRQRLPNMSR